MSYEIELHVPDVDDGVTVQIGGLGSFENGATSKVEDKDAQNYLTSLGLAGHPEAVVGGIVIRKVEDKPTSTKKKSEPANSGTESKEG